ncbi:HAD family hydrolase [Gephyromycinifex aptenodytis]|uniref:HAD family hydrolase n=1 Tax=Gephyromycinifex aptenodytis TaxID=2716227 RepID=UPI001447E31B|nr:HAD-IA family hydrolase [Gephyromycinifex aptenodytis]
MTGASSEPVHTVLLDADGVLQCPAEGWLDKWRPYADGDLDEFTAQMFLAELPALEGQADLYASIEEFLRESGRDVAARDEICSAWAMIEIFDQAFQVVDDIRAQGIAVHLATNQQCYRRDVMLDLGYPKHFDRLFFSCDLAVAKPSPDYFRAILGELRCEPEGVLFIDDRLDNVEAARSVGIQAYPHQPQPGTDKGVGQLRTLLRDAGVPGA